MDNEAPKGLREHFIAQNIQYELVPPFNHRANKAERAIQTFKRHFISILAGTHPSFPIDFWHELIPQAEVTLNMMRAFADQRNIFAYHGIHRKPYDFISHPLAPCGTLIVLHNSHQRETGTTLDILASTSGPRLHTIDLTAASSKTLTQYEYQIVSSCSRLRSSFLGPAGLTNYSR
jgi:hypothetical protein